jgi:hypothetical protein
VLVSLLTHEDKIRMEVRSSLIVAKFANLLF